MPAALIYLMAACTASTAPVVSTAIVTAARLNSTRSVLCYIYVALLWPGCLGLQYVHAYAISVTSALGSFSQLPAVTAVTRLTDLVTGSLAWYALTCMGSTVSSHWHEGRLPLVRTPSTPHAVMADELQRPSMPGSLQPHEFLSHMPPRSGLIRPSSKRTLPLGGRCSPGQHELCSMHACRLQMQYMALLMPCPWAWAHDHTIMRCMG